MIEVKLPTPKVSDIKAALESHNLSENGFLYNYIASVSHVIGYINQDKLVCRNPRLGKDGVYAAVDVNTLPDFNTVISYYGEEVGLAEDLLGRINDRYSTDLNNCQTIKLDQLYHDLNQWPTHRLEAYIEFLLCLCRSEPPNIKSLAELQQDILEEVALYDQKPRPAPAAFDDNAARKLAASGISFERVFNIVDRAKDKTQEMHRQSANMTPLEYQEESKKICVSAFDEIMLMIGYLMNDIKNNPDYFKPKD